MTVVPSAYVLVTLGNVITMMNGNKKRAAHLP